MLEMKQFEEDVIQRLSRHYYEELLYFTASIPDALINFNDVLLLKKGQKYVSHTNTLFQKAIASLFLKLYRSKGEQCSICKTDGGKGRGVYLKSSKTRVHFLGQEKFVNFPRVNWIDMTNSSDGTHDVYAVVIKKNEKGIAFVSQANQLMLEKGIQTKHFELLENIVSNDFDPKTWDELNRTLANIERRSKDFQWFGLIGYYNELTQIQYVGNVAQKLSSFNYCERLMSLDNPIAKKDLDVLQQTFVTHEGYKLLLGEKDFCSSFITSEWLFDNLNIGNKLEKTYVVAGYIKSIEQLMAFLIRESSDAHSMIGVQGSGGIKNVDVQSDEFFSATLGNMMYYLSSYSNRKIYVQGISNAAIRKSIDIVREWIKVERNGYFHKHNIQSTAKVDEIRTKTYLLYFLLIGGIPIN